MIDFATLALRTDSSGLRSGVDSLQDLSRQGGETERSVSRSMGLLSRSMALAGSVAATLAATLTFGRVVSEISEFEVAMSAVQAVTRASTTDLQALRDVAMELGATTEFTSAQAAEGIKFLGMAGFTAAEALSAIPSVLDLATGAAMGLAEAADIASNVISGFGLTADESARVADVLAAAASRSNTSVQQLGRAMSTVAPISAALGISLEDTAAAIGVLSDAGIQGERAGTSLRGIFASLASVTDQAREALEKYGLTAADVDPTINSFSDIMAKLSQAQLSAGDAMVIFGREAASGALALQAMAPRLAEFGQELTTVDGAAKQMATTMRDNLRGDIVSLRSAVSGLIITLGDAGLTAAIRGVIQSLTGLVRSINENVRPALELLGDILKGLAVVAVTLAATQIPAVVVSMYAVATAALASASGLSLMVVQMYAGAAASVAMTAAMRGLAAVIALAGGPWGILVGAIAASAAYFLLFRDNATAAQKSAAEAKEATSRLNLALGTFYNTAAPRAAAAAIDIANANYEIADAAFEAARAELERAQAIEAANRVKFSNARDPETGQFLDPEASLLVGGVESEDLRRTNAALEAYRDALALLQQRQSERVRTARAVTGSSFEAADATVIATTATEAAAAATSELAESQAEVANAVSQSTSDFKVQDDVLRELAETARRLEKAFADTATSIVMGASSAREAVGGLLNMLAQMAINSAFKSMFAGMFDPVAWIFNSKGNVFGGGNVKAFAAGGVVSGPTVFPMAGRQVGLMGEAGPEAIMPLSRGRDGKLGVQAEPQTIRLVVEAEEGELFVPRVRQISGNVALQVSSRVAQAQKAAFGSTIDSYDQRGTT